MRNGVTQSSNSVLCVVCLVLCVVCCVLLCVLYVVLCRVLCYYCCVKRGGGEETPLSAPWDGLKLPIHGASCLPYCVPMM